MLNRISAFASIAILIAAVLSAPAQASADPGVIGEDKPVVFTFKNVRMMDGTIAATANCVTVPSPRPTKSGSAVHWGAKITCDRVANLQLDAWVVQYINGYVYVADTRPRAYAVSTYLSIDAQTPCIGFNNTQWQVKFVPKVDLLPGSPPEGQSAIVWLTCE